MLHDAPNLDLGIASSLEPAARKRASELVAISVLVPGALALDVRDGTPRFPPRIGDAIARTTLLTRAEGCVQRLVEGSSGREFGPELRGVVAEVEAYPEPVVACETSFDLLAAPGASDALVLDRARGVAQRIRGRRVQEIAVADPAPPSLRHEQRAVALHFDVDRRLDPGAEDLVVVRSLVGSMRLIAFGPDGTQRWQWEHACPADARTSLRVTDEGAVTSAQRSTHPKEMPTLSEPSLALSPSASVASPPNAML